MAEPPYYSHPEASPVCPICGWYLEEAYHGCPNHGPVEPLFSSECEAGENRVGCCFKTNAR